MLHTNAGVAERFVSDVTELTALILAEPDKYVGGSAAIYGMAQSIPDRSIIDEMTWLYLDTLYAVKKEE
jgi:sphinganine-1-phosphate aldolase